MCPVAAWAQQQPAARVQPVAPAKRPLQPVTGQFGQNIDAKPAYIARLYSEEMHVLAGPGIKSLQELSGRKVNFSDVGSGSRDPAPRMAPCPKNSSIPPQKRPHAHATM
jgi:hypothetical protein